MSGLTFWAVNTIQQDVRLNDTRFGRDLGLLLAANVSPLIAEDNLTDLARFSARFYSSTSSVRYLIYANEEGQIFFGIPILPPKLKIPWRLSVAFNYRKIMAKMRKLPSSVSIKPPTVK